jgi:hypothetical protein
VARDSFKKNRAAEDIFSVAVKIHNDMLRMPMVLNEDAGNAAFWAFLLELPQLGAKRMLLADTEGDLLEGENHFVYLLLDPDVVLVVVEVVGKELVLLFSEIMLDPQGK